MHVEHSSDIRQPSREIVEYGDSAGRFNFGACWYEGELL